MTLDRIASHIRMLMGTLMAPLCLLAACSPQETPKERVIVANNPILHSATLLLASEGPAAANGLDLELKRYATGKHATEAMLKGEADFAAQSEFATVGTSVNHPELRIVAVLARTQADELLARRDRGIAKPADLRGKSIGIMPGTDTEFYLDAYLLAQGLRRSDVRIVPLVPDELGTALPDGKVDAVCVWEPIVYELKQRMGDQILSWPVQEGQDGYWLLVTRAQVLKEKPQAASRLLRAIYQAEQSLNAEPAAYRASLQKLTGTPPAQQEATWKSYRFNLSLPQELLVAMEAGARWRLAAGLTPPQPVPNYLGSIDTAALEAVRPMAVSLIR